MIDIFSDTDFLAPASAVQLMVEHGVVCKKESADPSVLLVWWREKCSCFHWSMDGVFQGVYTDIGFSNTRAWLYSHSVGVEDALYNRAEVASDTAKETIWQARCQLQQQITAGARVLPKMVRLGNLLHYTGIKAETDIGKPETAIEQVRRVKGDKHKPEWSLLPLNALEPIVLKFMEGAKKYGRDNWRDAVREDATLYVDALLRHLETYRTTDQNIEALEAIAGVATNALILIWNELDNQ